MRHEAMAVRRMRSGSVSGEELDFDARVDDAIPQLEERLAQAERSARSAEVLRRLKPDEATALLLKAEGHSYVEIGERQGWSYTKEAARPFTSSSCSASWPRTRSCSSRSSSSSAHWPSGSQVAAVAWPLSLSSEADLRRPIARHRERDRAHGGPRRHVGASAGSCDHRA